MRLFDRIRLAWKAMRWPGPGGSARGERAQQWLSGLLPGSRKDWAGKVGDRWRSSAVAIALNWILNSFPEAPLCIKRVTGNQTEEVLLEHAALRLLKRPNPYYGRRTLWAGTLISFVCDGNAYWRLIRNNAGEIGEIWYLPHFMVAPQWPDDGSKFLSHYVYTVNGQEERLRIEDVVHFRWGMDPRNMRKGLSPLAAQDRQIAGDNESSTYHAALLENFGIPGLLISPSQEQGAVLEGVGADNDRAELFRKLLHARTTGDERGKPIVSPVAVNVETLGFNPEELALAELVNQPLIRIFGTLGLDPMVAGQPSESKTYSNYQEARKGGWEDCILPIMAMLCEELDWQIGARENLLQEGEFFGFDTRHVNGLQPDLDALYKRLVEASGGPILTPNEARSQVGMDAITGGDVLRDKTEPEPTGAAT